MAITIITLAVLSSIIACFKAIAVRNQKIIDAYESSLRVACAKYAAISKFICERKSARNINQGLLRAAYEYMWSLEDDIADMSRDIDQMYRQFWVPSLF